MLGIINDAFSVFTQRLTETILSFFTNALAKVMSILNESVFAVFNEPMIISLLDFGIWVGRLVFVVSIVILLIDLAEEASSFKSDQFKVIEWPTIFFNIIKAVAFMEFAPRGAVLAMQVSSSMVGTLDAAEYFKDVSFSPGNLTMAMLIGLVAAICFAGVSIMRFGAILIQAFTPFLYVADIIRGHTTSMGDWMRQTIAIILTFLLQNILFIQGCISWASGSTIIAYMLWLTMVFTSKYLTKFGMSSGITGALSSVNGMAQGTLSAVSKIAQVGV